MKISVRFVCSFIDTKVDWNTVFVDEGINSELEAAIVCLILFVIYCLLLVSRKSREEAFGQRAQHFATREAKRDGEHSDSQDAPRSVRH